MIAAVAGDVLALPLKIIKFIGHEAIIPN